jgi:hypothetical protein
MKEISYKDFPLLNDLASYSFLGAQSDSVKRQDDMSYYIRIIKSLGRSRNEWEYFELDKTGLITSSPRGMAKEYNKKVRIIDMEKMVEEYKGKIINQW